jgi:glycerol dehydrogenase-like iron-containing ADH family enzyme
MAAPISFTLTGVGDQIAAAVAESLKHLQIDDKSPSASSIGEEVGKSVATALKSALSEIKKPALDASYLREQILGKIECISI